MYLIIYYLLSLLSNRLIGSRTLDLSPTILIFLRIQQCRGSKNVSKLNSPKITIKIKIMCMCVSFAELCSQHQIHGGQGSLKLGKSIAKIACDKFHIPSRWEFLTNSSKEREQIQIQVLQGLGKTCCCCKTLCSTVTATVTWHRVPLERRPQSRCWRPFVITAICCARRKSWRTLVTRQMACESR